LEKNMKKLIKTFWAQIKKVNESEHTIDAIVSNESVDRDGDIVLVAAFKRRLGIYRSHPVLLASHRHLDLQAQIGEAYDVKAVEDGLRAKFKYYVGEGNDEADWAFKLAAKGKAAYSIGFIPHAYEDLKPSDTNKGARRRFTDIELVEISQVCVPSNRDALVACYEEAEEPDRELADIALKMFEAEEKGAIPYSVHGDTAKAPEDAEQEMELFFVEKPAPDVTENYIRIRVRDPGDFREDSFRTVWISRAQGINSVQGKLKNPPQGHEGSMVVQSFLFMKDRWNVAEAQAWVREHRDTISEEMLLVRQLSQSPDFYDLIVRIVDEHEKSYIDNLLSKVGIKPEPEGKAEAVDMDLLKETVKAAVQDALGRR